MIQVRDIFQEAASIVGSEEDDFVFRQITDAVELCANKGDWDPLLGVLDIEAHNSLITAPPEVETILGLNICGRPALARDQMFRFHLNGRGDRNIKFQYEWEALGEHPIYRELDCPSKLIAYCIRPEDAGKSFWVEGFDEQGNIVRTKVGDTWMEGWPVPVVLSYMILPNDAPLFSRITRIRKADNFIGATRLSTFDISTTTGILLGIYQHTETDPMFRRLKIYFPTFGNFAPTRNRTRTGRCGPTWVRIVFRKSTFKITTQLDYIPLGNGQAILMMLRALRNYRSPGGITEAEAQEATALRWLAEQQHTSVPPVVHPIEVSEGSTSLNDKSDYVE